MIILIILIIFALLYYIFQPCKYSFTSKTGILFKASNSDVADLLEALVYVAEDLTTKINKEDGIMLRNKLQNTSFVELIDQDPEILAWNYDKGREIGIRIYESDKVIYSADTIITSLLHELAHSLCDDIGHEGKWIEKNNYLQSFKNMYIKYLLDNTFLEN